MPDQDYDLIADVVAKLDALGKEATQQEVRGALASLEGKGFASETTLAAIANLLVTLNGKDYAKDTTLAIVVQVLEAIEQAAATRHTGVMDALADLLAELATQQKNALTDGELRADPFGVDTGLEQPTTPNDTQPISAESLPLPGGAATAAKQLPDGHAVKDDYALGEVLPDQPGADEVLLFEFSSPVVSFWVAALGESGVVKVDHYGGTPSAASGIPIEAGGVLPIPEPATAVKIYAPTGITVTVWGQRR